MKRALLTTAALALGLAVAAPVAAQPVRENQSGPGPGMMHHGAWGGPGFAGLCRDTDAKIAGALAYAETRLKITDAQRAAWGQFAEQVKTSEPQVRKACDTMEQHRTAATPPSAPERVQHMEAMLTLALDTLKRIEPSMTALYAQLTPEQKKVADTLLPPHGPRPGRPGMPPAPPPASAPAQPK